MSEGAASTSTTALIAPQDRSLARRARDLDVEELDDLLRDIARADWLALPVGIPAVLLLIPVGVWSPPAGMLAAALFTVVFAVADRARPSSALVEAPAQRGIGPAEVRRLQVALRAAGPLLLRRHMQEGQ